MARSRSVIQSEASVELKYHSVKDMPWADIESAAGKVFNSEERSEILQCVDAYCGGRAMIEQAVSQAEVEDLKRGLNKFSKAL